MEVPESPSWTGKAVRDLTAGEIGDLLTLLEERTDDDLICRVLARELAERTASQSTGHSRSWGFE